MIVFRLCKKKYANDLTGIGAEKYGGRWNSKGVSIVYTSNSIATCTVESAVHLPLGILPKDYVLISIEIPDTVQIEEITRKQLPKGWDSFPHPDSTQKKGNEFIKKGKALVLKVPSASVQGEFNFLLNPGHADFTKVKIKKIEPFSFDSRLFNR